MKKYAPKHIIRPNKTTLVDYGFKCQSLSPSPDRYHCDPDLLHLLHFNRVNNHQHQQLKPNYIRRQNKRGKFIALLSARQKKLDNYSTLNRRMQSSVSGKPIPFKTYEDEEDYDEDDEDDAKNDSKSLSNSNIRSSKTCSLETVRFYKSR